MANGAAAPGSTAGRAPAIWCSSTPAACQQGRAGHVGVYLGERRMVEAPAPGVRVRIGSTNRPGYLGATRPGARGGS